MAEILEQIEGAIRVVKLEEPQVVDEQVAQQVGDKLNQILQEMSESAMLLNLTKVQFMASFMIGQLVLLRENARKKECQFAICNLNENLSETIKLLRIDEIVQVYENQAEAVEQLASD